MIVSYVWDFNDGSPLQSGKIVSHAFSTNNTFSVELTVIDNDGQNNAMTKIITINPLPNLNINITLSKTEIGTGESVNLTASPSDKKENYTYRWFENGILWQ